ncbi:hypothetical protein LGQ02_17040 [Bacillus shivajii]|uniref:DUF6612 family protein n=1 Tax=Bacillus shivajii TaxID=1983719 RepID=UPI001CF99D88|nr:DUF6612 family protein [Bacillus shivajii]UCZ52523.1 hypothetical protein LGQ02_17040 [Bacillus shivajii]
MKKSVMLVAAATTMFLAACNDEETVNDVESVLNDSIEAMEGLTSYSMNMDSTQSMVIDENEAMDFDTMIEMDLLLEPLTFFQKTSLDLGDMGMGMDMSFEYDSYFSEEDGFFIEDPFVGEWAKFPESLMDEFLSLTDAQLSPEEQIKPFKDHISELSLEETDGHYVIRLKGEGADMETFAEQIGGMAGEGLDEMFHDIWSDIEIHQLEYEIFIDKETNYQTEANIHMELTMEIEGESMTMEQTSHLTLSRFNELNDLQVPEEVMNNAQEMTEEDFLGGF